MSEESECEEVKERENEGVSVSLTEHSESLPQINEGSQNEIVGNSDESVSETSLSQNDEDSNFSVSDPNFEDESVDEHTTKKGSSSKSKGILDYIRKIGVPYGFGTYRFRRYYGDDEGGDSPIDMIHCENFFVNKLDEMDRNRSIFSFFYTHRHIDHPDYMEKNIYHHQMKLEGAIFRDIKEYIMYELGIQISNHDCRVTETRLWLMYLGSPFIVLSDIENELITNFEKRIRCTIDGFWMMLECRYIGEKFFLDQLLNSRSSWKFTTKCLEDPRFVDWMSLKRDGGKRVVLEDMREIKERQKFIIFEAVKEKLRVLEIKRVSVRIRMMIPKLFLLIL